MSKVFTIAFLALAFVAGAQADTAATMTSFVVTGAVSSSVSGSAVTATFIFTPTTELAHGTITITLPTATTGYFIGTPTFALSKAGMTATAVALTTASTEIVITTGGDSGTTAITVTMSGLKLGVAQLGTGGFILKTSVDVTPTAAITAVEITKSQATLTSVTVSSAIAGETGVIAVIVFKPAQEVPIGGTITLTSPVTGYWGVAVAKVLSNVPLLKGAVTKTLTQQIVTIAGASTGTSVVILTLYGLTMGIAGTSGASGWTLVTSTDALATTATVAAANIVARVAVDLSPSLETSSDLPVVGGRLTDGSAMSFAVAADKVPFTLSSGAVTVGFTMVNAVQVGGSVVLTLPAGYFTTVDATKSNTFTTTGATASCALSKLTTSTTDTITCTVAGAALAAGAQTLTLVAGAVTTGKPTAAATYNVATSSDQQLATAPAVPSLGGTLTAGSALAFTTAANNVPGTLSTDTVTVGFTAATAVPVGGTVSLILPLHYFTAVDSSKVGTFTTSKATCTCVLTEFTTDTHDKEGLLTCTVAGAAVAAGAQTLTLVAGTVTVGGPMDTNDHTFSMQTSTDLKATFSAFAALGGHITGGGDMTEAQSTDLVPLTTNTGIFTFPGVPATALPSGASITLTLPKGFFTSIDITKPISFATNSAIQATCVLNKGSSSATTDTITCATTAAVAAAAAGGLVFGIGSVKTGGPMAAGTFSLETQYDVHDTEHATPHIGGELSLPVAMVYAAATDAKAAFKNTGLVTFGFTTATATPVGGTITLHLPNGFLSAVDSTIKTNTVPAAANTACRLTCAMTKGATSADTDAVVCTVTAAPIAAGSAGVIFAVGALTTGLPQLGGKYSVETSVDLGVAAADASILPTGGRVTDLGALLFNGPADNIPGALNAGTVTFVFKTGAAGSIAAGGVITLVVPRGYFASVDAAKVATVAGTAITSCTATCLLSKAVGVDANDKVICTTAGGSIPATTAVTVTLIAGTVTAGVPMPPAPFQVSTSQENIAEAAGVAAGVGGFLSAGVDLTFTNALDQTSGKFTSNNATIKVGFTTVSAIPIGGKISLTLPPNYFSKVDATKSITVGTSGTTATCSLAQSSLSNKVPTTISSADSHPEGHGVLTINVVPSLITGFTQVKVPLAGFEFDSTSVAKCTANCLDSADGKVTASFASGVLTLTLPYTNMFLSANTLTTFTVTLVTNPITAGWATTNIESTMFKPYATMTCTTAAAIVAAGAQTLTFPALSVTVGTAQNAGVIWIETSVDLALHTPVAAPAIAIAATGAVKLAFSNPADAIPGRTNVGKLTLGFTSANSLSIGSLVLLKFPKFYFTRVDPKAANTLTDSAAPSSALAHINSVVGTRITSSLSCVLTAAVAPATQDTVTCTIGGSATGTGAQTLTFVPGAITTGLSAGGGFTVNTAPPPPVVTRTPYFPKAAGSTAGIAWVMVAVSVALAWL